MRSKLPLRIGKRCKRPVVSTRRHKPRPPLVRPNKVREACDLLTAGYGWFADGFDTRDLREAKALLEELAFITVG